MESLHILDQLKGYVQTSLSIRQNVQQTTIVQKVEQNEDCDESEQMINYQQVYVKLEQESDDQGISINPGRTS